LKSGFVAQLLKLKGDAWLPLIGSEILVIEIAGSVFGVFPAETLAGATTLKSIKDTRTGDKNLDNFFM
jgi:hypothetical protein